MLALILLGIVASAFSAPIVPVPPTGMAFVHGEGILVPFCLHNKQLPASIGPLPFYLLRVNHWVNPVTGQSLTAVGGCTDVLNPYATFNTVPGGCDDAGKHELRKQFNLLTGIKPSDAKIICS